MWQKNVGIRVIFDSKEAVVFKYGLSDCCVDLEIDGSGERIYSVSVDDLVFNDHIAAVFPAEDQAEALESRINYLEDRINTLSAIINSYAIGSAI